MLWFPCEHIDKKRLRLLFGNDYILSITGKKQTFDVLLIVPCIIMKCLVIDDEPLTLAQISDYISRVPFLSLVKSCQDAFEAMKVLAEEEVDLIFVDMYLCRRRGESGYHVCQPPENERTAFHAFHAGSPFLYCQSSKDY